MKKAALLSVVCLVVLFSCEENDFDFFDSGLEQQALVPKCVRYVDEEIAEPGDGTSWERALPTVEEAIESAKQEVGEETECEVRVKGELANKETFTPLLPASGKIKIVDNADSVKLHPELEANNQAASANVASDSDSAKPRPEFEANNQAASVNVSSDSSGNATDLVNVPGLSNKPAGPVFRTYNVYDDMVVRGFIEAQRSWPEDDRSAYKINQKEIVSSNGSRFRWGWAGDAYPNYYNEFARRVEIPQFSDATGSADTGSLEIGNQLRLDNDSIVTNSGVPLYLQKDNGGNLDVGNGTLVVNSNDNSVNFGGNINVAGDINLNGQTSIAGDVKIGSSYSDVLYVNSITSSVGIGTSTPEFNLDIVGADTVNAFVRIDAAENKKAILLFTENDDPKWNIYHDGDGSDNLYIAVPDRDGLDWTQTPVMVFQNDGKVGIGTDKLPGKLNVGGTIYAEEIVVAMQDDWPDFVFEEDYEMMTLDDVEKYIDNHGCLPDMPSAKDVAANGVSIGDTQGKLLQKIEELTLYLIEQNKEIEKLKANMVSCKN